MEPLTHRIEVDGCGIHVTVQRGMPQQDGGTRRALVCLHGGPGVEGSGQRLNFSGMTDVVDVVVPDQRGHGLSDLSTPDQWNLDRWADDVAAIIDELGLVSPIVFGISFGGWVALHHAFRHPRQAAGLIVASTTPRLPTIEQVARRMGTLGGQAAEDAWLSVHAEASEQAVARMQEACMPLMALRSPSPALAAVRATQRLTPQVNEHFTPQFQELDLTDELRTVAVPTLLIVGEHDPLLTEEVIASAAEALPAGGRLVVVPDAAHDLFVDAPDRLLEEVRRFVVAALSHKDTRSTNAI
ncbi:proline-specific peptidase [Catenulispora sp. GP43]|uniref:alpha/beta fold hydrolase n=1 Tax=Catenulispora sp. GP43 TaxID=3156263 RepID=UPI003518A19F